MHNSWLFYHFVLKAIFLVAHTLNVQGKKNPFRWYNPSNVHLVLLSQHQCHLLSLLINNVPNNVLVSSFTLFSVVGYGFGSWKSCDSIRSSFDYSQNWCSRNTKSIYSFAVAPSPLEPQLTLEFSDDSASSANMDAILYINNS